MAASAFSRTAQTVFPRRKLLLTANSEGTVRQLWRFLNPIFNNVDEDRVREIGPDRVAAEWIVRCGGSVRWRGLEKFHKDYNTLPAGQMALEAIDATESCIMHNGFAHLKRLEHLKDMNLTSCDSVDDDCLRILAIYQKERLEKLKIVSCVSITDAGLGYLVEMKALKSLIVGRLLGVENLEKSLDMLRRALPGCHIENKTAAQLADESSKSSGST